MNRRPNMRQRRFSLPATPTQLPVVPTRKLPEGSGDFQKAFEDLCVNEPNHARSKSQVNTFGEFGFNGLNKIQELNESDYAESEDEAGEDVVDGPPPTEPLRSGRRHSSPSCFADRAEAEHFNATRGNKTSNNEKKTISKQSSTDSAVKNYTKIRKEYFIKHGHFPMGNGQKPTNRLRPSSYHSDPRVKSGTLKYKT